MKGLVIFGIGGQGRETLQIIRDINALEVTWDFQGFIVDEAYASSQKIQGYPVYSGLNWLKENPSAALVIAVGDSAARMRIARKIRMCCQNPFATLIHPRATVGETVDIGEGSVVCAGSVVTSDIKISTHVLVNMGVTIGHDCCLEDFVTLNPGANVSGNVHLKQGVEIGAGAVIIPKCTVGEWSIMGAGTVAIRDVEANVTVVGAPARIVKERPSGWQEF